MNWALQTREPHSWLWEYYRVLLALRREHSVLGAASKRDLDVSEVGERTLLLHRRVPGGAAAFFVLHFAPEACSLRLRVPPGPWRRLVDAAEERFGGVGAKSPILLRSRRSQWEEIEISAYGAALYLREATADVTATAEKAENEIQAGQRP